MLKIDGEKVLIDNTFNSRELLKIKLFLSSLSDISISICEKEIIIINLNGRIDIFIKIIDYFSLFKNIELDQSALRIISEFNSRNTTNEKIKNELIGIKSGNTQSNDFNEFCNLCDRILKIKLRDYQHKSSYLLYLAGNGFDFSVPGAGKTIISYATYACLKQKKIIDSLFIVGPKNSYNAWYDEYITCFGYKPNFKNLSFGSIKDAKIYLGTSKAFNNEITFINYEKTVYLAEEIKTFIGKSKTLLIVDEAHKVKNPNAKQSKSLMEISKFANRRILLTGTPMPNGYEDLFSECHICFPDKEILPCTYGELRKMTLNSDENKEKEEKIIKSIFPYYSRVSKKYLLNSGELLPPQYHFYNVQMDELQEKIYNLIGDLNVDILNDWESWFALSLKKAITIRRMQASADPKLLKRAIFASTEEFKSLIVPIEFDENLTDEEIEEYKLKLEAADKIVMNQINQSEYAQNISKYKEQNIQTNKNMKAVEICLELFKKNKNVIIWDIFVDNIDTLAKLIEEFVTNKIGVITGKVPDEMRQEIIQKFKMGELKVLIANPATLAESISLHRCCQDAIYVNRSFNAAQFIQSKDRIHRINMPVGTTADYYFIENENSIDKIIGERLTVKENRMIRILDNDELNIGSIDGSDLSDMTIEDLKCLF